MTTFTRITAHPIGRSFRPICLATTIQKTPFVLVRAPGREAGHHNVLNTKIIKEKEREKKTRYF